MRKQDKEGACGNSSVKCNASETDENVLQKDNCNLTNYVSDKTLSSALYLPENSQLKPKLDRIFAEVENNLPTINFELSDLSSEEDVPIFNRSCKAFAGKFRATPSGSESSDDEVEKQMYEGDANPTKQLARKHDRSEFEMSDSKLASAADSMLRALQGGVSFRSLGRDNSGTKDSGSSFVQSDSSALKEAQFGRKPDTTSYQIACDNDLTATKGTSTSIQKCRSNEHLSDGQSARQTAPMGQNPLQTDSKKMVDMLFPDGSLELDFEEFNRIGERMVNDDYSYCLMNHGDSAAIHGYNNAVPIQEDNRAEDESLMEKLTKFAMVSASHENCANSSAYPQNEPLSDDRKNTKAEFCSNGTTTDGLMSQRPSIKQERRSNVKENDTVFIDLRTCTEQKRKELENMARIQRVLGLKGHDANGSSDESEGEIELWFEHRKRMRESLKIGKAVPREKKHVTKPQLAKPVSSRHLPEASSNSKLSAAPTSTAFDVNAASFVKEPSSTRMILQSDSSMSDKTELEANSELTKVDSVSEGVEKEISNTAGALKTSQASAPVSLTPNVQTRTVKAADTAQQEKDRQLRLRLEHQLRTLCPKTSHRGRQQAAPATDPIFDTAVSFEPELKLLPGCWSENPDCTLLTIHLASNGQIVFHDSVRNNVKKSIDQGCRMSASYNALVSWLLSLVPSDFSKITEMENKNETSPVPFQVIGLQQMAQDGRLMLNAVVIPVKHFTSKDITTKGKKCQQRSAYHDFTPFHIIVKQFLLRNTLQTVCTFMQGLVSNEICSLTSANGKGSMYLPSLPQISSQPLSTFIQLNTDSDAVNKCFLLPIGFYWETIDSDEQCHSDQSCRENKMMQDMEIEEDETVETMMSLVYEKVYRECFAMVGMLNRILQEGLCLCGLRLVYPTLDVVKMVPLKLVNGHSCGDDELAKAIGPVLSIAVRGKQARKNWLNAFGPADPALARRTDPNSLCALYGGESRDECLIFCPRTPQRTHLELVRWFGGRVRPDALSKEAEKSKSSAAHAKKSEHFPDITSLDGTSSDLVATLSATTTSDVVLVVSPIVPVYVLGLVLSLCQQRGYWLNGVRRLHLTVKQATGLGICGGDLLSAYAVNADQHDGFHWASLSRRPSSIFLLGKENARNSAGGLIEALMMHLTLQGIMGSDEMNISNDRLSSSFLFHVAPYSAAILHAVKGDFSKLPEASLFDHGCVPGQLRSHPELEQLVVVSVCGTKSIRKAGNFLAKLLGFSPFSGRNLPRVQLDATVERFELLGLKWLPQLTVSLAKELTPYEVGDHNWKQSIQKLSSGPALLIAVRGVNAFKRMESLINVSPSAVQSFCHQMEYNLDYVMSFTPEMAYRLTTIFFFDNELFADDASRPLLKFLPSFDTSRLQSEHLGDKIKFSKSSRHPQPSEEFGLWQESIVQTLSAEPQLLTAFLLVKPDAVYRHTGSLLKHIYQENFTIVAMRFELLNVETVQAMLRDFSKQTDADYLCSGPCILLALQRKNAVKKLLDVVGPTDPRETRKQGTYCWRTLFGMDCLANGLHCSCDYKQSIEDQKLFFPEGFCCQTSPVLQLEQIKCPAVDEILDLNHQKNRKATSSEKTVSMSVGPLRSPILGLTETTCVFLAPRLLKPVLQSPKLPPYVEIIDFLLQSEFEMVGGRMLWFAQTQAEHFLKLMKTGSFDMVSHLISGPSIVFALQKDVAILAFKELISRRSPFGCYESDIFFAKDLAQAGELLTFFFRKLSPSSLTQVVSLTDENI